MSPNYTQNFPTVSRGAGAEWRYTPKKLSLRKKAGERRRILRQRGYFEKRRDCWWWGHWSPPTGPGRWRARRGLGSGLLLWEWWWDGSGARVGHPLAYCKATHRRRNCTLHPPNPTQVNLGHRPCQEGGRFQFHNFDAALWKIKMGPCVERLDSNLLQVHQRCSLAVFTLIQLRFVFWKSTLHKFGFFFCLLFSPSVLFLFMFPFFLWWLWFIRKMVPGGLWTNFIFNFLRYVIYLQNVINENI